MSLANDLVRYFNLKNAPRRNLHEYGLRSITEFIIDNKQYWEINPFEIYSTCEALARENILHAALTDYFPPTVPQGLTHLKVPPFTRCYFSVLAQAEWESYGSYEFLVHGFPLIREHFLTSVRPLVATDLEGNEEVGTCFLLIGNRIVTAGHCVCAKRLIKITGWDPKERPISRILVPIDRRLDLAVLEFDTLPFNKSPEFRLGEARILSEVLTMGYPPIPGFQEILIAEIMHLSAQLKGARGNIVADAQSYMTAQNYLLMNNRVKGGNSGGPVINRHGCVIGVVTDLPGSDGMSDLGYGLVTPVTELALMLRGNLAQWCSLTFRTVEGGISTSSGLTQPL